jgi:hypothetical protein
LKSNSSLYLSFSLSNTINWIFGYVTAKSFVIRFLGNTSSFCSSIYHFLYHIWLCRSNIICQFDFKTTRLIFLFCFPILLLSLEIVYVSVNVAFRQLLISIVLHALVFFWSVSIVSVKWCKCFVYRVCLLLSLGIVYTKEFVL